MRRPDLTAREVAALAKQPGLHWVSANLYLDTTDGVSWVFRYMLDGRSRAMGLGPYPRVTLAEARARADQAWKIVDASGDPIEERRARKTAAQLERAKARSNLGAASRAPKVLQSHTGRPIRPHARPAYVPMANRCPARLRCLLPG